jgi:hypothetical protein
VIAPELRARVEQRGQTPGLRVKRGDVVALVAVAEKPGDGEEEESGSLLGKPLASTGLDQSHQMLNVGVLIQFSAFFGRQSVCAVFV